jgi:signal recognition particle subunit SRP54
VVILDTAGRLHIDDDMMSELEAVKAATHPVESLFVADAMTGQVAVQVAAEFHKRVALTGLILTKVDGDARGGAAISMRAVTGVPIKFLGVGEKPNALEPFQPDRLASRILGMGDVLTLIEKAEANLDQEQSQKLAQKFLEAKFDLEDFLSQLQQVKKMGPLSQVLDMIPGMSKAKLDVAPEMADGQVKRVEAIINSMTPEERHHPEMLGGSRKRRVARGSGTTVPEVNQLLAQFRQMQRMMKQISSQKGRGGLLSMFRQ